MKILIVSNSFYPENSPRSNRTTELAVELSKQGHDVTVIVPANNHDYTPFLKRNANIQIKTYKPINNKEVRVFGGKIDYLLNKFLEYFLHFPYIKLISRLPSVLEKEQNHDLMISIAFPHPVHWGVAKALKKNPRIAKKWIADCGDPFMKNDGKGLRKKVFYFKYFEKEWCRLCDFITVPYEQQRGKYYPEFANKIKIIPQGFDFSSTNPHNTKSKNKVLTFVYAGTLYAKHRNPRLFLEFLSTINVDYRFVFYTNRQDLVMPFKKALGEKLQIRDYVPRSELLVELRQADFLVHIENGHEKEEKPSKLIDYALACRPVLSINSFYLNKENILRFLKGNYSGKLIMPDINQYRIENVVDKFLDLMLK